MGHELGDLSDAVPGHAGMDVSKMRISELLELGMELCLLKMVLCVWGDVKKKKRADFGFKDVN